MLQILIGVLLTAIGAIALHLLARNGTLAEEGWLNTNTARGIALLALGIALTGYGLLKLIGAA
jgi:hypothetical protein